MNTCHIAMRRAMLLAVAPAIGITAAAAFAQPAGCFSGRDCCVVGMSLDTPRRYAVACDGQAQTASSASSMGGYPIVVFGPTTWERCGAWMNRAGIPGWAQYANVPLEASAKPPAADRSCFLGRNCCWVGSTYDNPPRFAIGYDGNAGRGDISLGQHGYHHIAFGPESVEACHAWWNANVAARGLGQPFPAGVVGAVPVGAGTFRAVPPAGPSGPRGPRPSGAGIAVALTPGAWTRVAPHVGNVAGTAQGLAMVGGAWTNGQVKEGRLDGNRVNSGERFDFGAGGDAYMAFAVNGGGKYMGFYPRVVAGVSVPHMSTHHSWAGSIVVQDGTLLFGHLHVDQGGRYVLGVARGGYDDHGGQVLLRTAGQLANLASPLELQFMDNYAGPAASLLITEAWVYLPGAQGAPGRPSPGTSSACGSDADCPGSVCLLGVCAPPSRTPGR